MPKDYLLSTLDVDDLGSMRRLMIALDYRLKHIVLNPMSSILTALTEKEQIWMNTVCACIRNHPTRMLLLHGTLLFSGAWKDTDDDVGEAIRNFCSLGPANVLLHPSLFQEEYEKLEENYFGSGSHFSGLVNVSDLSGPAPAALSHRQILSTQRSRQLETIARNRNITVSDIPVKEALSPLPPGPLLGSDLQIVNSGSCNNCRRRRKHCDRMEPHCTECRKTWDSSCAYSGPMAGTIRSLQRARQAGHVGENRKRKTAVAKRAREKCQIRAAESSGSSVPLPRTMGGREILNNSSVKDDSNATVSDPGFPIDDHDYENGLQKHHNHAHSEAALSISIPHDDVDYNGPYDAFEYNHKAYSPVSPLSPVPFMIVDPFSPHTSTDFTATREKIASAFQPVRSNAAEKLPVSPVDSKVSSVKMIVEIMDSEDEGDGKEYTIHVVAPIE